MDKIFRSGIGMDALRSIGASDRGRSRDVTSSTKKALVSSVKDRWVPRSRPFSRLGRRHTRAGSTGGIRLGHGVTGSGQAPLPMGIEGESGKPGLPADVKIVAQAGLGLF